MLNGASTIHVDDAQSAGAASDRKAKKGGSAKRAAAPGPEGATEQSSACAERGAQIFGTYDRQPELHNHRHVYLRRGNRGHALLWWNASSAAWIFTVSVAKEILLKLPDASPRLGASFCAYDPSPTPEGITSTWSVAAVGKGAPGWEPVATLSCRAGPTPEDAQAEAAAKAKAEAEAKARVIKEVEAERTAKALLAGETDADGMRMTSERFVERSAWPSRSIRRTRRRGCWPRHARPRQAA